MLRVGLTGELGSGKSTVAHLLAGYGAIILSSDQMGRALMGRGQPVFDAIVGHFGPGVLQPDGTLDRPALAALAFHGSHPRIEELNALIHPPVIAEQERVLRDLATTQPHAIVVIESALLFTTRHAGGAEPWRDRFDRIILVTAPDATKIERYIERTVGRRAASASERAALTAEAQGRLDAQRIPPSLAGKCILIENTGTPGALRARTEEVFQQLQASMS